MKAKSGIEPKDPEQSRRGTIRWLRKALDEEQLRYAKLVEERDDLRKRYSDLFVEYNTVLQERDVARIALASAAQSYQSFVQLNEQQNQIAKFLRLNYAAEIEAGEHGGMTLAQILSRYLARERKIGRWRRKLATWLSGRRHKQERKEQERDDGIQET